VNAFTLRTMSTVANKVKKHPHIVVLAIVFLIAVVVMVGVLQYRNTSEINFEVDETPLAEALQNPLIVLTAIVCVMSVNLPIAFELILDFSVEYDYTRLNVRFERLFMMLVVFCSGIFIVSVRLLPQTFWCWYTMHHMGCAATIYSICCKLVPSHFAFSKIFISYILWALAAVFSLFGFDDSPTSNSISWTKISVLFLSVFAFGIIVRVLFKWWKDIRTRLEHSRCTLKCVLEVMTDNEVCCSLYLFCTLFIVVPSVVIGACNGLQWERIHAFGICINVYSLALFYVLSSCIPGRYRQHSAKKLIEQK